MPTNPMQKKARNAFLLGVIVTIIICIIIGALLYFAVFNPKKQAEEQETEVIVYVLNKDVKSGEAITPDMLSPITVYESLVPKNYVNSLRLSQMGIADKAGNEIKTNAEGLYVEKGGKQAHAELTSNDGTYFITYDGITVEVDKKPTVAKINMRKNTVVTEDSITYGEVLGKDVRRVEYNMLVLPTEVDIGSFVDIRITFPNGQDLVIIPKKEIKTLIGNTVGFDMSEGEIELMESAIVESYVVSASKLYVTQYIEPGMQSATLKSYSPTDAVRALMEKNSSIIAEAYKKYDSNIRSFIDLEKSAYASQEQQNIQTGIQEEIKNAQKAREAYLSGLTSY